MLLKCEEKKTYIPLTPHKFVQFTGQLIVNRNMQGLCEKRSIAKDKNKINKSKIKQL